ncbi:hypothetical protein GOBAR_DD25418 [Gossypium barbadense]|nr:hypothetical protein GOBAR_DD25418 [Gossypium barbadense]
MATIINCLPLMLTNGLSPKSNLGSRLKSSLEKHRVLQRFLLVLALIGTCMVIGDGILTPAISVFSAVSGLELSMLKEHHKYVEVPVTCIILICLFALQHYGTHRVGYLFAPVILIWLLCISSIGLYNIMYWNPHVYRALSPYYMYKFLKKTQQGGSEAMFADLGHFSQLSIKIAFTSLVYPSLILACMGQAAYLSRHHNIESDYQIGFYVSVPGRDLEFFSKRLKILEKLRWPVLVIAILAAVVGSQAIITGTFSIIKQCSSLGCFPKVKIVHTSSKIHSQIYIPEIYWLLMVLCLAVTVGFRDIHHMGNASECVPRYLLCFFFGTIEALYFTASLVKFLEGAWVPIALSFIFLIVMCVWHYGTLKKYEFDVQNKVSVNWECRLYRCIVRYGYCDFHKDDIEFEKDLVCSIAEFARSENGSPNDVKVDWETDNDDKMKVVGTCSTHLDGIQMSEDDSNDIEEASPLELKEIQSPPTIKPRKKSTVYHAGEPEDGVRSNGRVVGTYGS